MNKKGDYCADLASYPHGHDLSVAFVRQVRRRLKAAIVILIQSRNARVSRFTGVAMLLVPNYYYYQKTK